MKRQLNKNEFLRCRRGYEDCLELVQTGHYKSALAEMKKVLRFLERDSIQTRMLAKCYVLMADIYEHLNQPEEKVRYEEYARHTLAEIGDHSGLLDQLREK